MKKIDVFLIGLAALALLGLLSSCSAIPTLPPLESTIIIEGPTRVSKTKSAVTQPVGGSTETPAPPTQAPSETLPPPATDVPTEEPTRLPTETERPRPSATATLAPTATEKPTLTPTRTPTLTPQPTATAVVYDYRIQPGSPSYLENFAHPEDGCDWLGVAGQAFDQQGEALKKLVVRASGTLNGQKLIDHLAVTGSASAYGPGGYELQLGDKPVETSGEVVVQLFDLDGNPLSEEIALDTYASCGLNLILVNFQEK